MASLKLLIRVAGVVLCFGIHAGASAQCLGGLASQSLPTGLKLTIRVEKTVAETARPVIVLIELSNQSRLPVAIWERFVQRDYELHVRDEKGNEVPLTPWGKQIRTYIFGSKTRVVLAPGEKHTDKEDLAEIYSVSVPGTYKIEACRDSIDCGDIYSNKITLPSSFLLWSPNRHNDGVQSSVVRHN